MKEELKKKIDEFRIKVVTQFFGYSNTKQIFSAGTVTFGIMLILLICIDLDEAIKTNGFWNLIIILLSAPISFLIWRFRDINATQEIENKRKDVNLKEFHKIAEWVAGMHIPDEKITSEKDEKYTNFQKLTGAKGLQIAAINSLLPFYRGEYGTSFRKPALDLLLSSWNALQQVNLENIAKLTSASSKNEFDEVIQSVRERADSPLGIAITNVLLSDKGKNLSDFPEVFPGLCLVGMDFSYFNLDENKSEFFAKHCPNINLFGAKFKNMSFNGVNFNNANLMGVKFNSSVIENIKVYKSNMNYTTFSGTVLKHINFEIMELNNSYFDENTTLGKEVKFIGSDLEYAIFYNVSINDVRFHDVSLKNTTFSAFCSMENIIFDSIMLENTFFKNNVENYKNIIFPNSKNIPKIFSKTS